MKQTLQFEHASKQQFFRKRQRFLICFPIHQLIIILCLFRIKNGYVTQVRSMESGNDKIWGKLNTPIYRPPNGGASSLLNIPQQNDTSESILSGKNSNLSNLLIF